MKTYIDALGRFIVCDFKANGKNLPLANIYAPNEDDPAFFKCLFDHLQDFQGDEIIIGGDFNLVLDVEKCAENHLRNMRKSWHRRCLESFKPR